jgi:hypothetical protein
MKIAIISGEIIQEIGEHYDLFPNTIFAADGNIDDFLLANSATKVIEWFPFDSILQNLLTVEPYLENGIVYTCRLVQKTEQELQADADRILEVKSINIRNQRNQLLKDSDWTQVADAPVDKTAWATYRQELRDITSQEGFPFNVVFPNPPL